MELSKRDMKKIVKAVDKVWQANEKTVGVMGDLSDVLAEIFGENEVGGEE